MAAIGPIAFSLAKVTGPPLILGAVCGAAAYYFDDFLAQNQWLVTFMGAFAGVGLGMFIVLR